MKKRKIWILSIFIAIFFTGQPIKSQVAPNKFKVSVVVTCDDNITKGKIESFIKRELRSLGDVTINNYTPDYFIFLTVLEPTYVSTGTKTGNIIVSSVCIKNYSLFKSIDYYLPNVNVVKEHFGEIIDKSQNINAPPIFYKHYINNLVNFDRTQNLQNICEGIVANFDTGALEPERLKR